MDDDNVGVSPSFPKYKKNALRPNPHAAKPERGDLAFADGTSMIGDFGDGDGCDGAGGAAVRPALGLPKTTRPTPKGEPDDTAHGWR